MSDQKLRFKCPCGRELKAPASAAGRKAQCPKCQRVVRVPSPEDIARARTTTGIQRPLADETGVREPVTAAIQPPTAAPAPLPPEAMAAEPMEAMAAEPVEMAAEPMEAMAAEPMEAMAAEPMEAMAAEPMEAMAAEPIEATPAEAAPAEAVPAEALPEMTLEDMSNQAWGAAPQDATPMGGGDAPASSGVMLAPRPPIEDVPSGISFRPDSVEGIPAATASDQPEVAGPSSSAPEPPSLDAARRAFEDGADRKARLILDTLIADQPADAETRLLSARLHERVLEIEEAVADYLAAEELGAVGAKEQALELLRDAMLDEARRAIGSGAHARAEELAARVKEHMPGLVEADLVLLEAQIEQGNIDAAWPRLKELGQIPQLASEVNRLKTRVNAIDPELPRRLAKEALKTELSQVRIQLTTDPAGAAARLRELREKHPEESDVYSWLGQALESCQEPVEAMAAYKRALELKPSRGKLARRCLQLVLDHDTLEGRRRWLDVMIDEAGHRNQYMLQARADLREAAGDASAITDVKELAELEPTNLDLHKRLAGLQRKHGEAEAAEATLDEALDRFPRHRELWDEVIGERRDRGDLAAVAATLERMLVPFGEDIEVYLRLAAAQREQGNDEGVDAAFDRAVQRFGAQPEMIEQLASRLEEHGRQGRAAAIRRSALEAADAPADAYEALAAEQRDAGLAEEAGETLRAMLGRYGNEPAAHRTVAMAQFDSGDPVAAMAILRAATERFGDDVDLALALADIQRSVGEVGEAMATYKALLHRVDDPQLAHRIAQVHLDAGDGVAAAEVYAGACQTWPDDLDLIFNRAACLQRAGRYEEAVELYSGLLEQQPEDRQALLNRAACYRLMLPRQHRKALEDMRRATELVG